METPACKVRRTTSVVVEQPASDKILVDSVPAVSLSMDDVSHYMFTIFVTCCCLNFQILCFFSILS